MFLRNVKLCTPSNVALLFEIREPGLKRLWNPLETRQDNVRQLGERPGLSVGNEHRAHAGVAARLKVVEVVADHDYLIRRQLPGFADLPQSARIGFIGSVFAANDRIER